MKKRTDASYVPLTVLFTCLASAHLARLKPSTDAKDKVKEFCHSQWKVTRVTKCKLTWFLRPCLPFQCQLFFSIFVCIFSMCYFVC